MIPYRRAFGIMPPFLQPTGSSLSYIILSYYHTIILARVTLRVPLKKKKIRYFPRHSVVAITTSHPIANSDRQIKTARKAQDPTATGESLSSRVTPEPPQKQTKKTSKVIPPHLSHGRYIHCRHGFASLVGQIAYIILPPKSGHVVR